ncbi:DUF6283 family protein [Streptomyces sp. H27-H5]|nr:DUF6283 family protein [Streptomyces sp. H27-H5]
MASAEAGPVLSGLGFQPQLRGSRKAVSHVSGQACSVWANGPVRNPHVQKSVRVPDCNSGTRQGGEIRVARELPHRKAPCNECPWRTDVPVGRFSLSRFEEMRATSTQPDARNHEAMIAAAAGGQELFACHKGDPATGEDLACAGWLAVDGHQNLTVRFDVAVGRLPAEALRPDERWPQLYESYDAMVDAQTQQAETD